MINKRGISIIILAATCLLSLLTGCSMAKADAGPGSDKPGTFIYIGLSGNVVSEETGKPIENITVSIVGNSAQTSTNPYGFFSLKANNVDIGQAPNEHIIVRIADDSGIENGGRYDTRHIKVPIDVWSDGKAFLKTGTISLTPSDTTDY